uniref:Uncharacterized protein n=1 Tax=Anguilla anguilla TaxID=7936 RepID=A0A0E9RS60_ANGAN
MPTLNISAAIKRTIITFSLKHNQHYYKIYGLNFASGYH